MLGQQSYVPQTKTNSQF